MQGFKGVVDACMYYDKAGLTLDPLIIADVRTCFAVRLGGGSHMY